MKVLLDENLPHALRKHVVGHDVYTVQYQGWSGLKNGALLTQAAADGFEVMVTMDSGVPYQQNVASIPLAIVILSAPTNDIDDLLPLVPSLLKALGTLRPKTIVNIP
jgi:hypothetical protein